MSEQTRSESPERCDDGAALKIRTATDLAVRLGVLFLIAAWCLQIVAPFIGIMVWALVIAIAATKPFEELSLMLGRRRGLAAAVFVLLALIVLIVPAVMLSETLISGAKDFAEKLAEDSLSVPQPPDGVATWPIVGERIYESWRLASENLGEAIVQLKPQLQALSKWLLAAAGSAGIALVQLLLSLVISGVLLAKGEGREGAMTRLATRLAGGQGPELVRLANATVRSVVQGILGVAIIQSVLAGLGFIVVGVPAAGLWALLVLVAAVVQLPVLLVMIPPVLIVFSTGSTTVAVAFIVWSLLVSLLDNFLKPILFGRGAGAPTVVIFIGAIGGMLAMGIIGLFVGAVVLTVGYDIFNAWLSQDTGEGMLTRPE